MHPTVTHTPHPSPLTSHLSPFTLHPSPFTLTLSPYCCRLQADSYFLLLTYLLTYCCRLQAGSTCAPAPSRTIVLARCAPR